MAAHLEEQQEVKWGEVVEEHLEQLMGVVGVVRKVMSCVDLARNEQLGQQWRVVLPMGEGVVLIWKEPAGEEVPES